MINNDDHTCGVFNYFPPQRNPHKFNFRQCNFYGNVEKQIKNNGFKIIEQNSTPYDGNHIECEYNLNKQNIIIHISVRPW